jgi:tol-pal system protein YbgF
MMSTRLATSAVATAAFMAAVAAFAEPAQAQRLSLAERVDRLEQQTSGQAEGSAVDRVNQISALQSQVQALQGQVEELRHALEQSQQRAKDQYVDLDSRLGRLEGHAPGAAPAPAAAGAAAQASQPPDIDLGNPASSSPSTAADPGNLTPSDQAAAPPGEAPVAAADIDASTMTAGDPAAEFASYNEAFQALKDGRYADSARRFQSFIDQYPNSELTSNAYYWLGESYYVTQNYQIAEQSFQTLLQRYPKSQKAPDALLKIGYSQYELKQWDQAEATLNQVVQTWPDSTAARLAQGRLRALKLETRR